MTCFQLKSLVNTNVKCGNIRLIRRLLTYDIELNETGSIETMFGKLKVEMLSVNTQCKLMEKAYIAKDGDSQWHSLKLHHFLVLSAAKGSVKFLIMVHRHVHKYYPCSFSFLATKVLWFASVTDAVDYLNYLWNVLWSFALKRVFFTGVAN